MSAQQGRYEWGAAVTIISTYRDLYGEQEVIAEVLDGLTVAMALGFARNNQDFDGRKFLLSCGFSGKTPR